MADSTVPLEISLLCDAWNNVKKNLLNSFCEADAHDEPCLDFSALPGDAFGDLLVDLDNGIAALAEEYESEDEDSVFEDEEDAADVYSGAFVALED